MFAPISQFSLLYGWWEIIVSEVTATSCYLAHYGALGVVSMSILQNGQGP
jgi:hypothetical protein